MDTINYSGEVWKEIPAYEGFYSVSNMGRVKRIAPSNAFPNGGNILKGSIDVLGYPRVALSKNNKVKYIRIHQLVARCFIPKEDGRPQVNHKRGDKTKNTPDQLEWCTRAENIVHAWEMGLCNIRGSAHSNAKLTEEKVLEIRALLASGMKQHPLAYKYGVTQALISRIKFRKIWTHI